MTTRATWVCCAIGNWIWCDSIFIEDLYSARLPLVFTSADHFAIDAMKISICQQINCFACFVEANTEHDFFILTSLKNWNKNQRAKKMHALSPQIWHNGCHWSVHFWCRMRHQKTSSIRRHMQTTAIVTISTTDESDLRYTEKNAMKRRWKRNDMKLIFCRDSQQPSNARQIQPIATQM